MENKIKILLLEDDDNDALLIENILITSDLNVEIIRAKNKESYLELLDKLDFNIVISDYTIPHFEGIKALVELKKRNKNIPFIFCSGTINEEKAIQCLQLGAMDYVLKDKIEKLIPAVKRAIKLVTETIEKEKLEKELIQFKRAVENVHEVIFYTNPNGIILYANKAFEDIYGWKIEEVINKTTPRILKSGLYDKNFYSEFWNNIKSKDHFVIEMINRTKKGDLIEAKNMIISIYDANNKLIGFVAIQSDISERKKKERELQRAKEEAEEMNKIKSYFLSNINHELRTPLISILGFSEELMNEITEPELKEYAKYIHEAGQRLNQTLNNILSLVELEKKRIEIKYENINLIELLKDLINQYSKEAEKKGLKFITKFESHKISIHSDYEITKKVLSIILDNSIKYTNEGGILLSVRTEKINSFTHPVINIVDTGIGIQSEKIKHIFEPFRQVSEGLTRTYEGLGIGLTIAKQLLDLIGVEIKIQSQLNKGTMITLIFPTVAKEEEIKSEVEKRKITIVEEPYEKKSTNPEILLVEDNPGNRMLFKKYLSEYFIVDEAIDGLEAIAKAELKSYDLILMDIHLGAGIDGVEAFKRIKSFPKYKNTPVIAITAYGMTDDREKFIDAGFTDYLKKSIMRTELIETIYKYTYKNN